MPLRVARSEAMGSADFRLSESLRLVLTKNLIRRLLLQADERGHFGPLEGRDFSSAAGVSTLGLDREISVCRTAPKP